MSPSVLRGFSEDDKAKLIANLELVNGLCLILSHFEQNLTEEICGKLITLFADLKGAYIIRGKGSSKTMLHQLDKALMAPCTLARQFKIEFPGHVFSLLLSYEEREKLRNMSSSNDVAPNCQDVVTRNCQLQKGLSYTGVSDYCVDLNVNFKFIRLPSFIDGLQEFEELQFPILNQRRNPSLSFLRSSCANDEEEIINALEIFGGMGANGVYNLNLSENTVALLKYLCCQLKSVSE